MEMHPIRSPFTVQLVTTAIVKCNIFKRICYFSLIAQQTPEPSDPPHALRLVLARLYLFLLVGCWFVGPFILSSVYPVAERECGSRAGTGSVDGELDGDRRRRVGRRPATGSGTARGIR
jgi:hypothetical protein